MVAEEIMNSGSKLVGGNYWLLVGTQFGPDNRIEYSGGFRNRLSRYHPMRV